MDTEQMHELWAVESLVQVIEQEGRNQGFSRVKQVRVKVGALSHFEPDALRFCFDAVSKGTIAEGACLELETVSAEGRCLGCGRTVSIARHYDLCPECRKGNVEMTAGDELRLAELTVE
jgi:hydrogenase nickel incorporation protein HypA/HybF